MKKKTKFSSVSRDNLSIGVSERNCHRNENERELALKLFKWWQRHAFTKSNYFNSWVNKKTQMIDLMQ